MKHSKPKNRDLSPGRFSQPNGILFVVWMDEQNWIRQFELSGHAGFAESGQDIVCAAVSALSITAANGLEHFLSTPPLIQEKNGFLDCKLEGVSHEELVQAQWILGTLKIGIEGIKEVYGNDYIKIEQRRWTPC